nr:unnamed protein product [Callosobruchus analis]
MVMCFVPDCKHYSERKTSSFFRFPKDPVVNRKWISLIRRGDKDPSPSSLVCSCHFMNGDKTRLPTLFKHNENKLFSYQSPERKKIKRSVEFTSATPSMEPRPSTSYDPEPFTSFKPTDSLTPIAESVDEGSSIDFGGEDVPSVSQTTLPNYTMGAQTEAEIYFLRKENEELKAKLEKRLTSFSFDEIKNDDKLINMYTGLPNAYIFEATYSLFENMLLNYVQGWTLGKIAKRDQFLLTLMKLRLNPLHNDLACRFNVSQGTVTNVVSTWIDALHEILFCQLMKSIPTRNKNKQCMPACFSSFTNCRIVLDCTEVKCARPSSLEKQRFTYSSYKHFNTVKGLVGVAPNGVITFISELYPGSVSDKKIVQDSAILNKMSSGDLI